MDLMWTGFQFDPTGAPRVVDRTGTQWVYVECRELWGEFEPSRSAGEIYVAVYEYENRMHDVVAQRPAAAVCDSWELVT